MRIQELERQVGIERATIRFYEKEGLITPERSENGYRDYSDADAAELQRIKLLRELCVSLDTIRNLQAGKEDFAAVMRRQSHILQGRRDQMERARIVCDQISDDGVTYIGMDTGHYQNLLNAPLLPQPPGQGSGKVFEERDYREPHPWRRFFARFLDYELTYAVLWFIATVVLRWRVVSDVGMIFIGFAVWFIQVPIEAAWIHFLGTTPGKWIFGIRVEAIEGGKLTYGEALERAWRAYYAGMGLNIPLLRLWCFWRGYRAHKDEWDTDWDEYSEVSFRDFNWKNWVLIVVAYAAAVGLGVVSELEAQLPSYRSNELTVAQFSKNFNFYDQLLANDSCQTMYRDGTMQEKNYTENMVLPDFGELEYDPWDQFEYEMDGDAIKAIHFNHTWYERDSAFNIFEVFGTGEIDSLSHWIPTYCRLAMITAMASQEGITSNALAGYIEIFNEDIRKPASDGLTATYGAVTCSWDLGLELIKDYPEDSTNSDVYEVTLDLTIKFG
ncbi:MAG: MerR family transcriptional regulator [Oscillospiraceae bacterium]|nr:MerR family transcriptional regulator [Oscillospiraceae bacterium]